MVVLNLHFINVLLVILIEEDYAQSAIPVFRGPSCEHVSIIWVVILYSLSLPIRGGLSQFANLKGLQMDIS